MPKAFQSINHYSLINNQYLGPSVSSVAKKGATWRPFGQLWRIFGKLWQRFGQVWRRFGAVWHHKNYKKPHLRP